ncbi:phage major tail tube protein [Novosphingopyxis sp. YJ-S2-01]|uniref:phage major tail tube protein n=1 Tax=Novosphingopyxis sp. YJ-S2-01 TaxID=2794021 RepID=UPI0018DC5578|nr:phage major tail tube protein [Novosphingopyxis sp. YJ-S2-01]MBH9537908.1 phage major tail tube protein [Novosphingopyxis sp. YJ-S2-01]
MSLPTDLKDFALFADGRFVGEATMSRAPKLSRKMEEWIAGGMAAPIEVNQHLEKIDCEYETRGFSIASFEQFGITGLGDLGLRFVGAYQQGNDGAVTQVEHVIRGNHKELEAGEHKRGENGSTKVSCAITVYTLLVDDREVIHVDKLAGIERYNGTDVRAPIRAALGL